MATTTATPARAASSDYSPVQQRFIDLLGRRPDEADVLDPSLAAELRDRLEHGLADAAYRIPAGESLWVGKTHLHTFVTCPGSWHGALDLPFRWTIPTVRGTVSHKAIELTLNWRGPAEPSRMVDAAIAHLIEQGYSAGKFLRGLSTVELAELRCSAVELVTAFEECFPPLRSRWRPVLEGRLRAEFGDGKIVLAGRPDLTLGQAARGGKVIIDLKSGGRAARHADDLRFYALVDTLRVGIPPRRLATVYLDAGQPVVEEVSAEGLSEAVDRVVSVVDEMTATRWGGERIDLRSGPHCGWCPVQAGCVAGQEWERRDDIDRERW